jgi:uncharacterized protein YkwD
MNKSSHQDHIWRPDFRLGWVDILMIGVFVAASLAYLLLLFLVPESSGATSSIPAIQNTFQVGAITPLPTSPGATVTPVLDKTDPATTVPVIISSPLALPDEKDLQQYMLELINDSRSSQGLVAVVWDEFAAQVGQAHAEEMAGNGYMSHWDLAGQGPDIRYSLAGGFDCSMENVYSFWQRYDNGTPVPIQDWKAEVKRAHDSLMNSPGHRANIMMPEHTRVGIGMAYDLATGEFRIAQEFVNHYIQMDPIPQSAEPNETITIHGQLLLGSNSPLINIAYESAPRPMPVDVLNKTSSYSSPAKFVDAVNVQEDSSGGFTAQIRMGSESGLYHIRIWVKIPTGDAQSVDAVVWVGINP